PEDTTHPLIDPDQHADALHSMAWANRDQPEWAPSEISGPVPDNSAPPLAMTPLASDAVGTYGPHAIAWVERTQKVRLRWWQRLTFCRALEHRSDGSLCYRVVIWSAPRRSGKSVALRGLALWRMAHAELLGEQQLVMHTGSDVAICREIQRGAWRWAEEDAGWDVMRANGKEALETPGGDRWLVRAQNAVYGYDVCLGMVDEGWDVAPGVVTEGLEPATLERCSPQLVLTSTAHRRATSLMRGRIQESLTDPAGDSGSLLLLWTAAPGADPSSEATWRAASPHWSADRRKMIAGRYDKALAGELDAESDDLDPMVAFQNQYLNVWERTPGARTRGYPIVAEATWDELAVPTPDGPADTAGIESWWGDGVSLALAWHRDGRAIVQVSDHPDIAAAAAALDADGCKGRPTVGASLMADPALKNVRVTKGAGRTAQAVAELQRLLASNALRHTGGATLTEQVRGARTLPGADGQRITSKGRADAIKAAMWAATTARRRGQKRTSRIILPTAV
ncbi:MAG: HNH endonuclease, partial [Nocardioidaceae bacterium]